MQTDGYEPFRPRWTPEGNHRAFIQDAHDAGVDLGRPFELNLGLYPWHVDGVIDINPLFCRHVTGQGTEIDFRPGGPVDSGFRIQQTRNLTPHDYGQSIMCMFSHLNVTASPAVERVFNFRQDDAPDQENASAKLFNVQVRGGQYAHFTDTCSYLMKAWGCQFMEQTVASIGIGAGANSGEAIEFTDCTIHDAAFALKIHDGTNKGVNIRGGSIDYLQQGVIDTFGGRVTMRDVWIELRAMRDRDGNPSRYFNMDGGTNLLLDSCLIAVVPHDDIPIRENLFQIWGQGGAVTLTHCIESAALDLSKLRDGKPIICSDPDRLSFVRRLSEHGHASMTGLKSWNYV